MATKMAFTNPCPTNRVTTTSIPLVMNNNHGWSTQLDVMDTGPETCGNGNNVFTITYYDANGNATGTESYAVGEMHTVLVPQGGKGFVPTVGSATITSNDSLVVTTEEVLGSPPTSALFYSGFSTGPNGAVQYVSGPTAFMPLLQLSNHGWQSGIAVQNVGTASTPMTLYVNGAPVLNSPQIAPNASWIVYPVPGSGTGTGYITTNPAVQVVAIANQVTSSSPAGSTYSAFGNNTTIPNYDDLPALATNFSEGGSTWNSGLVIMNISTNWHCYYLYINSPTDQVCLAPYASYTWYPIPGQLAGLWSSYVASPDGGSSAAIVNWIGTQYGTNDVFFTYPGGIR